MKIKLESVNATTFLFGGLALEKGAWIVKYKILQATDATTGLFSTAGEKATLIYIALKEDAEGAGNNQKTFIPAFEAQPYTSYVDSTGTAYGSFDATVKALQALIATPTSASTNDLFSDKASVTQATSKTTAVTSNTLSTIITTVALTDALDTAFSFTFTNSKITATSIVLPSVNMNGGTGKAIITVTPASGSATVTVSNVGVASFNSAIKIGLVVI
jgi:hypothetical protein